MPKSTNTRVTSDWETTAIPLIKGLTDTELTVKFSDVRSHRRWKYYRLWLNQYCYGSDELYYHRNRNKLDSAIYSLSSNYCFITERTQGGHAGLKNPNQFILI